MNFVSFVVKYKNEFRSGRSINVRLDYISERIDDAGLHSKFRYRISGMGG